jgi:hypothetical protein
MSTPVARIRLDTRSWGPATCLRCVEREGDEEEGLEDVILMSDGSFACPVCSATVESFDEISNLITSAEPICPPDAKQSRAR